MRRRARGNPAQLPGEQVQKNHSLPAGNQPGPLECDSLVIATGGLSFPKIGATDFGYRIARQFGLKISATRPGLVPLLFSAAGTGALFGDFSGISLDAIASAAARASAKTFCSPIAA